MNQIDKQEEALRKFLFDMNWERTLQRETCFLAGYRVGYADAVSDRVEIGISAESVEWKDSIKNKPIGSVGAMIR